MLANNTDLACRDASGTWVEIGCADQHLFREYTAGDYKEIARSVVAARERLSNPRLQQMLKVTGFNCTSNGFLHAVACGLPVDPCTLTVDWMHTFLQDGVLVDETLNFLNAAGVSCDSLRTFLRDEKWRWPAAVQRKGSALHHVFNPKRSSEKRLRATCSEMLAVYGMVRFFAEVNVDAPAMPQPVQNAHKSFMACCSLMDTALFLTLCVHIGCCKPRANAASNRGSTP